MIRHLLFVTALIIVSRSAYSLPFAAETTTRESLKITAVGASPTYAQLSADSRELVFQEKTDGSIFMAFTSEDPTIDDFAGGGAVYNRCDSGSGQSHVYWYDRASGRPGVCVSVVQSGAEGNDSSFNPRLGGADGDEGRYVLFNTNASNLASPASTFPQIVVHDRKFEQVWLSAAKCASPATPPSAASTLNQLSDDGRFVLFTSAAGSLIDNLSPTCTNASPGIADVYIRDGGDCADPGIGFCKTSVLYDDYDLHAGGSTVSLLDDNSANAFMTADQTVVVFDTDATVPVKFLPDVRGHRDIYRWKNNRFSLLSQTQLAIQSATSGAVTVKNVGGSADADSTRPRVDSSGKLIVFESTATDLVLDNPGVTTAYKSTNGVKQIYLYNLDTERIEMVSTTPTNAAGNGASQNAWISRDGRFIAFESNATNLVSGLTTTSVRNIFLRDRVLNQIYIVTPGTGGSGLNADATITQLDQTGLLVAFQSTASDANASSTKGGADTNNRMDVFLAANSCPLDTDGDKTPDCLDTCPTDISKTSPLQCGCGKAETDTDGDATADCNDGCKTDPLKTAPGGCGCGVADTDSDGDGAADCVDECVSDPTKTAPGLCGCGQGDNVDGDGDSTPDCVDSCPTDGSKSVPGVCGCGFADSDGNGNGYPDCGDPKAGDATQKYAKIKLTVNKDLPTNRRSRALLTYDKQYQGTVNYNVSLSCPGTAKRATITTSNVVRFINLPSKVKCTVKTFISVGTGANKVSTVQRTDTFTTK